MNVHPLSLEARITRKARITGLPRWEAAILVMDEVEELERRTGLCLLPPSDRPEEPEEEFFIDEFPESAVEIADRAQNDFAEGMYAHERREWRNALMSAAVITLAILWILSVAFLVLAFVGE